VIHEPEALIEHVLRMLDAGGIVAHSGRVLPTAMHSICVHGDTLGAVDCARRLRGAIEAAGATLLSLPELIP